MSTLPPPPAPEQQYAPAAPAKSGNGLGIAALIIGIIALIGALIPFLNYGAWFLGLVGLVLGIIGLVQKNRKKGVATAGTIISGVAIILSIVLAIAYTAAFANAVHEEIKKQDTEASQPVEVVYDVTGTSTDTTITYSTYSDGGSGSEQASNQALPWTKSITVKKGGTFDFSSFTLSAMAGQDGGDVSCKITVGGKVVSEQKASGQFANVLCSATGTGDDN
jgi:predicted membrane protein